MLNLKNYLIKYSIINSKFIEDFFDLYNFQTSQNDFVINLNIIVKWLKTSKGHIKETLTRSYVENIDYTITKNKSTGGRPSENILITPDCFKRLCMSSKTEKAEEVRTYFIEIEKHLDKYKNYIIDGLNNKVQNLENNQKPIIKNNSGIIYILKTDKTIENLYKIGKTKNFQNRIKSHNNSHIDNVEIKFIYETKNIDRVEKCLINILKDRQYRKRKEFYQIDLDLLKELIDDCENLILKAKHKLKLFKQTGGYFLMLTKT